MGFKLTTAFHETFKMKNITKVSWTGNTQFKLLFISEQSVLT